MKNIGLCFLVFAICLWPSRLPATATLGSLTLTRVAPRIISPNGDGYNDKARFEFDNPEDLPVTGEVYNLSGSRIADLKGGTILLLSFYGMERMRMVKWSLAAFIFIKSNFKGKLPQEQSS